ncbi:MAG TPA: hypothetical protein PL033_10935 [Candidatus Brocadiia bacterium]|nr:hypothetical protein [Candidatus Brocadiia bacterium]
MGAQAWSLAASGDSLGRNPLTDPPVKPQTREIHPPRRALECLQVVNRPWRDLGMGV